MQTCLIYQHLISRTVPDKCLILITIYYVLSEHRYDECLKLFVYSKVKSRRIKVIGNISPT